MDALRKKLADHVQESNKKYSDLLQEKLDAEDAMKEKFNKEKKRMLADFEDRIKEEVAKARAEEIKKKERELSSQDADW